MNVELTYELYIKVIRNIAISTNDQIILSSNTKRVHHTTLYILNVKSSYNYFKCSFIFLNLHYCLAIGRL